MAKSKKSTQQKSDADRADEAGQTQQIVDAWLRHIKLNSW